VVVVVKVVQESLAQLIAGHGFHQADSMLILRRLKQAAGLIR